MTVPPMLSAALADRYRLERELGQGGMATVYLAADLRHDRKVALKVLRPELAAVIGAERFLAEIKTTANLQHPHILPLHDSGEVNGTVFYVMPYVEGEGLRDRLRREKQLPVDEAIQIACEVAGALDYAHRHGIIHRDIKPENILLHDGSALVADFGIALAASRSEGGTRMTETGMSLGTPHYMSPEQAMGEREITARSDVYALGCVLYEMLTGEPPFNGPTAQAIIARVMTEEPRGLAIQRRTIPAHVEAAVRVALHKLPADRFASARDFAEALTHPERASRLSSAELVGTAAVRPSAQGRLAAGLPWGLAAAAAGLALWGWLGRPAPAPPGVERATVRLPASALYAGEGSRMAMAPDGSRFVYAGVDSTGRYWLYLRSLDADEPVVVPGSENGFNPVFSPDGQSIAFAVGNRLYRVPVAGGTPSLICTCEGIHIDWGPNDQLVMTTPSTLVRVSATGGAPEAVDSALTLTFPRFLPDGRRLLVTDQTSLADQRLQVLDLETGRRTPLDLSGSDSRYVEPGYLVYGTLDGRLMAVPFDAEALRVTGPPMTVEERVRIDAGGLLHVGIGRNGSIVFAPASEAPGREVVLVDLAGGMTALPIAPGGFSSPRFSPDGRKLALIQGTVGTAGDVWIYDFAGGTLSRLTFETTGGEHPEWTRDGRRILFSAVGDSGFDIAAVPTDFSGGKEYLVVKGGEQYEAVLLPDGKRVLYREFTQGTGRDIWIRHLDSAGPGRPLVRTPFEETAIAVSPDARLLAYLSTETGVRQVYVRALEDGGGRVQVSDRGGSEPRWAPSGRELYYRNGDSLYAAALTAGPAGPEVSSRRALFAVRDFQPDVFAAGYDVSPDGRRFVFIRVPTRVGMGEEHLRLLLHWFEQRR